jgi:Sec-independent protein secretion pathway component TatC
MCGFIVHINVELIGNLKLFLNQAEKNKQIKWSTNIYGAAILIVICGLLTPPDILSNVIISGPLTVIYILFLRQFIFKKLGLI